jgi:hypothetical protein
MKRRFALPPGRRATKRWEAARPKPLTNAEDYAKVGAGATRCGYRMTATSFEVTEGGGCNAGFAVGGRQPEELVEVAGHQSVKDEYR